MIRYTLLCEHDHEFESWFDNSAAYDKLQKVHLVDCPHCGSKQTRKALMTPQISGVRGNKQSPSTEIVHSTPNRQLQKLQKEALEMARKVRQHIQKNSEHVGDKFASEARKMHNEETDQRTIYGSATTTEVKDLLNDGIDITPLPDLPEDKN
ncbi:MAG: DUF1178 family protein [Hyphomicrobiaceae bacterium]|nr:DUF1178 family protein [Hyphomicrobiaceae bacterium]